MKRSVDFRRGDVRQQGEILTQRLVGNAHHLAELRLGRFADADVVAETFAHAFLAVESDQDRQSERDLRSLTATVLQVAGDKQAEKLLGAAEFDVGADFDGVPTLHQGI